MHYDYIRFLRSNPTTAFLFLVFNFKQMLPMQVLWSIQREINAFYVKDKLTASNRGEKLLH